MKDFTKYEYEERLAKMTELLSEAEGWGDAYESSTGQTLIQLMTHVTDELHYMLQRRTTEQYLETARLRSSVIARACELGYRYKRAKSNTGYIKIDIKRSAPEDILIEKFTVLKQDGNEYFTLNDAFIRMGERSVEIQVKQGKLERITETLSENESSIVIKDYEYIDNEVFQVRTGDAEYEDVRGQKAVNKRALSFLEPEDEYYDILYSIDGLEVTFGDNFQGKKPSGEVEIAYSLVDPRAEALNIIGKEFELAEDHSSLDTYDNLEIINSTRITGFTEPEDTASVKRNAVDYHRTNGRAVTNEDYEYWVRDFDGVDIVDVKVIGEDEIQSIVYNLNNVYITYITSNGNELSIPELEALRSFMNTVKTTQAHLVFRPAKIVDINLDVSVGKDKKSPLTDKEAYDIVYKFLEDYFKLKAGSIGGEYQASDIINEMYKLTVRRNGIVYPVVDFVKLELMGAVGASFPLLTNRATLKFSNEYDAQTGDNFVLQFGDELIQSPISETDTIFDIVTNMKTQIMSVMRLNVKQLISGLVTDYHGKTVVLEPREGGFYVTAANDANRDFVTTRVVFGDPTKAEHYFYGRKEGRKPAIPVYDGTEVEFTTPNDIWAKVYFRPAIDDEINEVEEATLNAEETFTKTYDTEGFIIIEYQEESERDAVATLTYSDVDIFEYELDISVDDDMGKFTIDKNYGDVADYVNIDFELPLPAKRVTSLFGGNDENITMLAGSIIFLNELGETVLRDDGNGKFIDEDDIVNESIYVDYVSGTIFLSDEFASGNYRILFKQNIYENFTIDESSVMKLIMPNKEFEDEDENPSKIRIV